VAGPRHANLERASTTQNAGDVRGRCVARWASATEYVSGRPPRNWPRLAV